VNQTSIATFLHVLQRFLFGRTMPEPWVDLQLGFAEKKTTQLDRVVFALR
jgi:hypothetical protein